MWRALGGPKPFRRPTNSFSSPSSEARFFTESGFFYGRCGREIWADGAEWVVGVDLLGVTAQIDLVRSRVAAGVQGLCWAGSSGRIRRTGRACGRREIRWQAKRCGVRTNGSSDPVIETWSRCVPNCARPVAAGRLEQEQAGNHPSHRMPAWSRGSRPSTMPTSTAITRARIASGRRWPNPESSVPRSSSSRNAASSWSRRRGPHHTIKSYDTSCAHIIASVENSLRCLRTDYLDLLLIHRPDPLMDPREVNEAFVRLRQSGKVHTSASRISCLPSSSCWPRSWMFRWSRIKLSIR